MLDELDERLIGILQRDGRTTNHSLATSLGVSPATVRGRLKRLEASGAMRVAALTDLTTTGRDFLVLLMVRVKGPPVEVVAQHISALEGALTVTIVTGGCDIFASVAVADRAGIIEVITSQLGSIEGISDVSCALALDVIVSKPVWGFAGFESSTQRSRSAHH